MGNVIDELIGVYDADSTLIGELSYWVGARVGRVHCALCDLTHGTFTVKSEWRRCAPNLGVPFHTFHRDDAPADVTALLDGRYPAVLERSGDGLRVILDAPALEGFAGSTTRFLEWLESHLAQRQ